ncbi:MAG: hypothetical protein KIT60_20645 [Burkholderiaceae bacterium]|nr:hypothetical protein [Burkholderiaceae bacterium]
MKPVHSLLALTIGAFASASAMAQFVKGNEAVKVMPDGTKKVETPPIPAAGAARSSKPCAAADKCHGGAWLMVETADGLVECTEAYARPGTCRASSYGTAKLLRVWVVKKGSQWLQCQLPDGSTKCVSMFAKPPTNLPFPAVQ